MRYGYDSCPDCGKPKASHASRCRECYTKKASRHLAYMVHRVDSGQTSEGALGLAVGRKMRQEEPVRPCPIDCPFCAEERSVVQ